MARRIRREVPYPCASCNREVRPQQHAFECDVCGQWQHRTCGTGISQPFYFSLLRKEVELPEFRCCNCPHIVAEEIVEEVADATNDDMEIDDEAPNNEPPNDETPNDEAAAPNDEAAAPNDEAADNGDVSYNDATIINGNEPVANNDPMDVSFNIAASFTETPDIAEESMVDPNPTVDVLPDEPVTFRIVEKGSQRGGDLLVDSDGYSYNYKSTIKINLKEMAGKSKLLKVVLLGDGGVGKSSLMNRFVSDKFDSQSFHTIGVEFLNKDVIVNNQNFTLQIWDTAGQERFKSLRTPFYRGADCCLMTFAVDDLKSFRNLAMWQKEFFTYADVSESEPFPFVLLGNKCDKETRSVLHEQAEAWCQTTKMPYFETSAKDSTNVDLAFHAVVERMIELESLHDSKIQPLNTIDLRKKGKQTNSVCCN